jgi:DNA-binding XRE family transcriptional regulator
VPGAASIGEARRAAGLSQSGLAAAAGLSRQAVGAIESDRHRPSVDAAIAIARVLGRPVEELFGAAPDASAERVFGTPLPEGSPVLAARVGNRTVYAAADDALAIDGWPNPNATLSADGVRLLERADLDSLVIVGCDPAVALAGALLPAAGAQRTIALSASTATALAALRGGRAHAALVHARPGRLPRPPAGALRLHVARWRVGIAQRGRRARTIAELAERRIAVVQREPGASSQKAFVSALASTGRSSLPGPVAAGHLEAARRVADGAAAGVTMEPAALRYGLSFRPLEEHVAELWVDARWRAHPAVVALAELLGSPAFASRLGLVGGYELTNSGEERG